MVPRCVSPLESDALQNLALRLLAEPVEVRDFAGLASRFQLLDGLDAKLLVERPGLLRSHAGDLQHLDQSGGHRGFDLLVVFQAARRDEFGHLFLDALADAGDLSQSIFRDHLLQRLGEVLQRAGRVRVGAGFERVLALQLQQRADLDEQFRDFAFVHAR
jgi:hypothetical protein